MLGQQAVELVAHRREGPGLDLDEQVAPPDVDHEATERHLELVAGSGVLGLERGVERTFVERADVGFEGDRSMVDAGLPGRSQDHAGLGRNGTDPRSRVG